MILVRLKGFPNTKFMDFVKNLIIKGMNVNSVGILI